MCACVYVYMCECVYACISEYILWVMVGSEVTGSK